MHDGSVRATSERGDVEMMGPRGLYRNVEVSNYRAIGIGWFIEVSKYLAIEPSK